MKNKSVLKLCESGILLALALLLSFAKISLPFGGSVTLLSMLPIALIGYRHGMLWGSFSGLAFGLIKMLLGMENLQYATSFVAVIFILLFDYFVAYSVVGLAGIFKGKIKNRQNVEFMLGTLFALILRYISHIIVGYVVWAPLAVEWGDLSKNESAFIYSITYNGTYMIPEIIITVIGAFLIASVLDFRKEKISPLSSKTK